jgi:hypothetical protein
LHYKSYLYRHQRELCIGGAQMGREAALSKGGDRSRVCRRTSHAAVQTGASGHIVAERLASRAAVGGHGAPIQRADHWCQYRWCIG